MTMEGFFTRSGVLVEPPAGAGPAPIRKPDASTGRNADSGVTPDGPTNSACAHTGSTTSGAFDPFSCTTSQSLFARDTSMSDALADAVRPATGLVYKLSGSGGRAPSILRAAR